MVHTLIRLLRRRKRELAKRDGRRRSLAKRGKVEESDVFGSSSESLWQRASASDGEIHSDDSFADVGAAGAPKTKSGPRRSLISSASPQAANALGQTPLHVLCGACGSGRNSAWGKARNTACSRGGIGEAGVWAEQFAVADSAQPSWAQSSGGDSGITEDAAECLKWSAIVADARNKGLGIYSVLSFARVLLSAGVDPLIKDHAGMDARDYAEASNLTGESFDVCNVMPMCRLTRPIPVPPPPSCSPCEAARCSHRGSNSPTEGCSWSSNAQGHCCFSLTRS